MIAITYSGYYNVFAVNINKTIVKIYSGSLLSNVPNGVYCAEMNISKQYLLIGSFASNSYSYKQTSNGIFIWMILDSEPWLKFVDISNEADSNNDKTKVNY